MARWRKKEKNFNTDSLNRRSKVKLVSVASSSGAVWRLRILMILRSGWWVRDKNFRCPLLVFPLLVFQSTGACCFPPSGGEMQHTRILLCWFWRDIDQSDGSRWCRLGRWQWCSLLRCACCVLLQQRNVWYNLCHFMPASSIRWFFIVSWLLVRFVADKEQHRHASFTRVRRL
jgi:hypothetical protein